MRYRVVCACALVCLMFLSSCKDEGTSPSEIKDGNVLLMLNIQPVATRSSLTNPVQEMIESLRIIILDADEMIIEENYLVEFNDKGPQLVSNFNYFFTWETHHGTKRLYLIANEGYVGEIEYEAMSGVTLPAGLGNSLTALLGSFQPDSEFGAQDFVNVMDAIYFTPSYEANDNGEIFLPYVSMYEEKTTTSVTTPNNNNEAIEWTTYMVPVATNFIIQFLNYRPNPVYISNITVNPIDTRNFLFARVGEDNLTMDLNYSDGTVETGLYWVDWLAKVAKLSQMNSSYPSNSNFNSVTGWISDYTLPVVTVQETVTFVEQQVEIPAGVLETETAAKVTFGPFYLPESLNELTLIQSDGNGGTETIVEQAYYLSFGLEDSVPDQVVPVFKDVRIGELKSLFRDTNVVITVVMTQGEIEIYATIQDWNPKTANGWVVKQ